ncbi:MAG: uvrB [Fibrobacteria bacterium]|jgi:excinuclease ABC subunit B|nr:uvrB [Fibrobacteria bacterium]
MSSFDLTSPFEPSGDQPAAIDRLVEDFQAGAKYQTLLGVTGSGKTFTMANVIQQLDRPTLVLSHNKTLAAQLYQEFKAFFPHNAVEYFVSYYDYYQPEAYMPVSDTYIEKDSNRNEEIEKLRLRATASLMSRRDTIVISSVSCIYGLGTPVEYAKMMLEVKVGAGNGREELLRSLIAAYYTRNDIDFKRATFRARGDVVEVRPAYDDFAYRIEFFGDEVERIRRIDVLTGEELADLPLALIYPARHYVTSEEGMDRILADIRHELDEQEKFFITQGKLLEAQRLKQRTTFDLEMLKEIGFCSGIENYSRIIENRPVGSPPSTLLDFFPKDFLLMVDESHVSIPQIRAMYNGDQARKRSLVDYGFRLPCALDNRPLKFEEFEERMPRTLFVSATPAEYELEKSGGEVVEQVIRPTGLLDPEVEMRPTRGQIDDLLHEIQARVREKERVLVTTLTKRSAEDLTAFLKEANLKVEYMHSDTDTIRRSEIIRELREGEIDVLVGINLLREGLDLPEVSLVAILDADKEGFLRSRRSLIQTIGRAARNVQGKVILYGDVVTDSIRLAMDDTAKRRARQLAYNTEHGITPTTIRREIHGQLQMFPDLEEQKDLRSLLVAEQELEYGAENLEQLRREMIAAADAMEFERAALLRDKIAEIEGGRGKKGTTRKTSADTGGRAGRTIKKRK